MTEMPNGNRCRREERRALNRYPIQGQAWFRWQEADSSWEAHTAATRDISSHGAFIVSTSTPTIGTSIEVIFSVPPVETSDNVRLRLRGRGRVIRLETGQGFAVEILFRIERAMPPLGETGKTKAPRLYPAVPQNDGYLLSEDGRELFSATPT